MVRFCQFNRCAILISRPKTTKVTRLDYCQYLISSQKNYTLTNFSEYLADLSQNMINRYLRNEHLTPSLVWEHTQPTICQNENEFLVFDDSI